MAAPRRRSAGDDPPSSPQRASAPQAGQPPSEWSPNAPTDPPPTSVIVVSQHRPKALALCLTALALQDHPAMEVVLVADPASLTVRPDLRIRRIECTVPNISHARNLGINVAAGAVLAFIDDDAVAEPTWAGRLAAAFADPQVIAAGGYTRGPHGRSWQVRAEAIGPDGPRPLPPPPLVVGAVHLYRPADGVVLGLLGTNCAFRAGPLRAVGGFDPAFAYHLDESDLVMRLAARLPQAASALVPAAEVTHGTAPSARRDGARVPRDLAQIGRSEAIFAARHGGDPALIAPRHRRRLLRHMLAGRLDPFGVAPRMASLLRGMTDAPAAPPPPWPDALTPDVVPPDGRAFQPIAQVSGGGARPAVVLSGPWRRRRRLREQAADAAAHGEVVTLLLLVPGLLAHRTRLTPGGWWEQTGGTLGPSQPDDPLVLTMSAKSRIYREVELVATGRNRNRHMSVACPDDQSRA